MKRIKKAAAAVLAAFLVFVSLPLSYGAAETETQSLPCSVVELGGTGVLSGSGPVTAELTALDRAMNADGVYLHYSSIGMYPFVPGGSDGASCGESGNAGVDNSVSSVTAEYYSGEARNQYFSFMAYYSTEADHDFFIFSVNGEEQFRFSGEDIDHADGIFGFNMLLEADTNYTFTWSYVKDGSGSDGDDCVRIMDVFLSRHLDTSTAAAINAPGCPFVYTPRNNYFGFYPYECEDGRICAAPGCLSSWEADSDIRASYWFNAGDVITFDYYCQFDPSVVGQSGLFFGFTVNAQTVLDVQQSTNGWQTFSYTVTDPNNVTSLKWYYHKSYYGSSDNTVALIDNVRYIPQHAADLDAHLNHEGSHLAFTTSEEHPFICMTPGSPLEIPYAISGNRYIDDSVSSLGTHASVLAGDMIVFTFYCSSGTGDFMALSVDGSVVMTGGGTDHEDMATVGVIFYEEGEHEIEWSYVKDGGESIGGDCLKIANVYVDHTLDAALNVPGGQLSFYTTQEFPFVPVEDGDRLYAQSTNNWDNELGALACDVLMRQGDTLTFEYWLDSMAGYDGLVFAVNGEVVFALDGVYQYWQEYRFTCPADGDYHFEWIYVQGDFTHTDINCVRIDNVAFSGVYPGGGDVNGDGRVTVTDAILTLRASMGLVDLTDEQTAEADVNGDGRVTVTDAILILRIAMGIV